MIKCVNGRKNCVIENLKVGQCLQIRRTCLKKMARKVSEKTKDISLLGVVGKVYRNVIRNSFERESCLQTCKVENILEISLISIQKILQTDLRK